MAREREGPEASIEGCELKFRSLPFPEFTTLLSCPTVVGDSSCPDHALGASPTWRPRPPSRIDCDKEQEQITQYGGEEEEVEERIANIYY